MQVRYIALALPLALGLACKTSSSPRSTRTAESGQTSQATRSDAQAQNVPKTATDPSSTSPAEPTMSGTTPGAAAATPPLMEPGASESSDVKAHSDDQVVSGRIAKVTRRAIAIESDTGERKTLALVPETWITVDGQDAKRTDLQQGQDVRASFNEVNGREIAVMISAGETAADRGGSSSMERTSPTSPDSSQTGSTQDSSDGVGGTGSSGKTQ